MSIELNQIFSRNVETEKIATPTFYLCAGVSGAGCTTTVDQIARTRWGLAGPGQIVSRNARPGELRAGRGRSGGGETYQQYYFVQKEHLGRVRSVLRLAHEKYNNLYGFTGHAINWINDSLRNSNVILDALGNKDEWGKLLDNKPIITLFFAPSDPDLAAKRIAQRSENGGVAISREDLKSRVTANAQNIAREIVHYDFWVDTTILEDVIPAVISLIKSTSTQTRLAPHPAIVPISQEQTRIQSLISTYQTYGVDFDTIQQQL